MRRLIYALALISSPALGDGEHQVLDSIIYEARQNTPWLATALNRAEASCDGDCTIFGIYGALITDGNGVSYQVRRPNGNMNSLGLSALAFVYIKVDGGESVLVINCHPFLDPTQKLQEARAVVKKTSCMGVYEMLPMVPGVQDDPSYDEYQAAIKRHPRLH